MSRTTASLDGKGRLIAKGLLIRHDEKGQTDAMAGTVTLVAGNATVSTTAITADSKILLSYESIAGTPGFLTYDSVVAGTSFRITSKTSAGAPNTTDTGQVFWVIVDRR
jgi:hypothetical protein